MSKSVFAVSEHVERQESYSHDELITCGAGDLFGEGNAQLPSGQMLMFDRIVEVSAQDGKYGNGYIVAEFDITPELWFFDCHFSGDPVMPGCLGLDALWQLLGFQLAWLGHKGRGRAIGAGQIKFIGQILPECKTVVYKLDLKRIFTSPMVMGVADGVLSVDDKAIYQAKDLRVGLFSNLEKN